VLNQTLKTVSTNHSGSSNFDFQFCGVAEKYGSCTKALDAFSRTLAFMYLLHYVRLNSDIKGLYSSNKRITVNFRTEKLIVDKLNKWKHAHLQHYITSALQERGTKLYTYENYYRLSRRQTSRMSPSLNSPICEISCSCAGRCLLPVLDALTTISLLHISHPS